MGDHRGAGFFRLLFEALVAIVLVGTFFFYSIPGTRLGPAAAPGNVFNGRAAVPGEIAGR